jgi:hypothetical protein
MYTRTRAPTTLDLRLHLASYMVSGKEEQLWTGKTFKKRMLQYSIHTSLHSTDSPQPCHNDSKLTHMNNTAACVLLSHICGLCNCSVLKFCSTNKINALRIPISLALALNPEQRIAASSCAECPPNAKSWDMLDTLFNKAAAVGILIVLDMHRMDPVSVHTIDILHIRSFKKCGYSNVKSLCSVAQCSMAQPVL